jgi:hypothetical protein
MLIIGSKLGQTLVFLDKDDMTDVIRQLSGMLEWIEASDIKPPYVYHQYDGRILVEDVDEYTDWLKETFGKEA